MSIDVLDKDSLDNVLDSVSTMSLTARQARQLDSQGSGLLRSSTNVAASTDSFKRSFAKQTLHDAF